jgi:acetyltransferase
MTSAAKTLTSATPAKLRLPDFAPAAVQSLEPFFGPRSVAVVGATERAGSVGRAILGNLASWSGEVFPVNAKRTHVLGRPAFASVAAIPSAPDLAVIVTPAASVPDTVAGCAAAGVKGAVIISAGFKECGAAGADLERAITERRGSMRIIGPNCLGIMVPRLGFNATFAATIARPGSIAFLSQSGALCTAVLDWSLRENVGFSAFVSLGSMLDVGWGSLIDYLGDDPNTKSIVCYMESVGDARAFLSAAREVSFTKPIIVIKVGRTEAAARAAASHTGSLTGSDAVLDAAFRRAGVLRVNTIQEVFDMAEVLAKQPRPAGPRLAVVTNAGGPGALATDMLVASGGELAELTSETCEALQKILPPAWSHGNPIDMLGAASAEMYTRAAEIALHDPNVDGLLVVLTPQAMTDPLGTAAGIATLTRLSARPILASWMGGASLESARALLNAAGIPTYDQPDAAARAFALMWRYSDNLRLLYERPVLPHGSGNVAEDRGAAERLIAGIRQGGRTLLTEMESKQVLAAYGIPVVETVIARSCEEAVAQAGKLGFPVVLKLHSQTITHKTDVGGVVLDLHTASAVRRAWKEIRRSAIQHAGTAAFDGVTVEKMVRGRHIELILGSSIDPQFGPVLLFGAGGEMVEVLRDRALGLPPLTVTLARRLMEQTRVFAALSGARGRKPVDLAALAQLLVSFSHLVTEQRWIAEIDVNPLVVDGEQFIALDARIVLHPPSMQEHQLPRLAIRPYPAQYVSSAQLDNGTEVTLRPIRPEDEEMLVAFHATLSEESVQSRYFGTVPLATRTAHDRLVRRCFCDYDRDIAIVAEYGIGPSRELIGIGRLSRIRGRNDAEFAVIVADAWQHHGLGLQLMKVLVHIGRAEKLDRIVGTILARNQPMLRVCRKLGFRITRDEAAGECRAELQI